MDPIGNAITRFSAIVFVVVGGVGVVERKEKSITSLSASFWFKSGFSRCFPSDSTWFRIVLLVIFHTKHTVFSPFQSWMVVNFVWRLKIQMRWNTRRKNARITGLLFSMRWNSFFPFFSTNFNTIVKCSIGNFRFHFKSPKNKKKMFDLNLFLSFFFP